MREACAHNTQACSALNTFRFLPRPACAVPALQPRAVVLQLAELDVRRSELRQSVRAAVFVTILMFQTNLLRSKPRKLSLCRGKALCELGGGRGCQSAQTARSTVTQRSAASVRDTCVASGPAAVRTAKRPSSDSGALRAPSRTHERRGEERSVQPAAPGGASQPARGRPR